MKRISYIILLLFVFPVFGLTLETTPPLPLPSFPDTEVSTNIALRVNKNTAQMFDLRLSTICTPSNSFQVAFGCDTDFDNVLSPDETDVVYGWRGARWFIEDVQDWNRKEVPAEADGAMRTLTVSFETRSDSTLRKFQIVCEGNPLFEEVTPICTSCFFNSNRNLMRLTRRGEFLDADSIHLSIRNKGSLLYIR